MEQFEIINEGLGIQATKIDSRRYPWKDHQEVLKQTGITGYLNFITTGDIRRYEMFGFAVFFPDTPEFKKLHQEVVDNFGAIQTDSYSSSVRSEVGKVIRGHRHHFVFPSKLAARNARKFLHDVTGDFTSHNIRGAKPAR